MDIKKIGVVGAGTMGNGIAHVFSLYNYNVILSDIDENMLEKAIKTIILNLKRQVKKNIINESKIKKTISLIKTTTKKNDLKECDLVVEAIKEDFNIKKNLFIELDHICKKNTVLASNTSSISINKLANCTKRKDKIIGMHFMNPVPIMQLVEIINASSTSNETSKAIVGLSKNIGKIPVSCNDSPGFVSNRILMPMINEAVFCYSENVADVKSIDSIMKLGMGHPMGPLRLADLIGIDVCINILNVLYDDFNDIKYKPCKLLTEMADKGKLGKKSGEGFYKYEI